MHSKRESEPQKLVVAEVPLVLYDPLLEAIQKWTLLFCFQSAEQTEYRRLRNQLSNINEITITRFWQCTKIQKVLTC